MTNPIFFKILGFFVVLGLLFSGCSKGKDEPSEQTENTEESALGTESETTGETQTYMNEEYGYSVEYPSDNYSVVFKESENEPEAQLIFIPSNADKELYMWLQIYPMPDQSLEDFIKHYEENLKSDPNKPKIVLKEETAIDGEPAMRYVIDGTRPAIAATPTYSEYIVTKKDGNFYISEIVPYSYERYKVLVEDFHNMLNSFRFL